MITLTGFTDEALATFPAQVRMASRAGLTHVELRRIGMRPILDASPTAVDAAAEALAGHGVRGSCIATGLGKAPVDAPMGALVDGLERAAALAHRFDTPFVRVFSFHTTEHEADRPRVLSQMAVLAEVARTAGVTLLHENEKGVFGDTPQRCLELVEQTGGGVRLIFDPANFVQCGVRPFDEAFPLLVDHIAYLHAKDARAATGRVTPVGEGDGQWGALAAWLRASGWEGFVSLEPHLGLGGRGGPVTPRRWVAALDRLRTVLAG
ncbi:MAG TPA: sugar phosphate isomerase/epimerase [Propionibacterium sp.]|nr:sugar phosphate isomerase/epimerase [Propionibacterium sp.]